ncbi:MAG TPA: glycosyltransferase family 4 protein [Acidimicrobiales bacterium]|nr:glycosyltransferase family 4 protein [Acidimicrobiales bacterium]
MRVGIVCPYSLSIPGGVQGQVLGIAGALRRMGVEARVLAPCDGPPPETWVSPLGGSVAAAGNGSIAPIAPGPAASLRTIRALRDERFDIVHLHEPFVPGPTLTALLFSDGPLIGTFHRAGEISWYRAMRGAGRRVAKRLAVRCAVSALALDTASQAFGGKYELVWNGIDVELVSAAAPWPTGGPTVLFLGRHEPRKGLAVLIEAVVRYGIEARIWVAGEGPETSRLKESTLGDPRFEWLGTVGEEEKLRRLRGADVLAAPSLHGESFGMVLLEGMAAGTAVVASRIPGYANVARPSRDALLVPPGDAAALAAALVEALANGPEIKAMRESGYERASEHSLDSLGRRYLELYEPLVAHRAPRSGEDSRAS